MRRPSEATSGGVAAALRLRPGPTWPSVATASSARSTRLRSSRTRRRGRRAAVHLGVDLFVPAGQPVHAPLAGTVVAVGDNARPAGLRAGRGPRAPHGRGVPFFTLYGHLVPGVVGRVGGRGRRSSRGAAARDDRVGGRSTAAGRRTCTCSCSWTSSAAASTCPGLRRRANAAVWESLSPDPNLLLGDPRRSRGRRGRPDVGGGSDAAYDPVAGAVRLLRRTAAHRARIRAPGSSTSTAGPTSTWSTTSRTSGTRTPGWSRR